MLHWWSNLSIRGKLAFWAVFGIVLNLVMMHFGAWMPALFYSSVLMLLISPMLPSEDDS